MFSIFSCTSPPVWVCRSFARPQLKVPRHLSHSKKSESLILFDQAKHRYIYYFPYVRMHAALPKLKVIIPTLTCLGVPVVGTFMNGFGRECFLLVILGLFQYVVASFFLKYNKNIIGTIAVNKGEEVEEIIIGSLNEKGKRVDRSHKPKNLIVCGFSSKINEAIRFATIKDSQLNIVYKINTSKMKIMDKKVFESVFGNSKIW